MFQFDEEARRTRAGVGKPAGGMALSGVAGAMWTGRRGAWRDASPALEGMWRRIKRCGGSCGSKKRPAGGGRVQRENREEGARGRR
jgi:hypothetical protein